MQQGVPEQLRGPRFYDHVAYQSERSGVGKQLALPADRSALSAVWSVVEKELDEDVIVFSSKGEQKDDALLLARSTVLRALPIFALNLPLSILAVFSVWWVGLVQLGFVAYVVWVVGLWGAFCVVMYMVIAWQDHRFSFYGLERLKAHLFADVQRLKIERDYEIRRASLDAYIKLLLGDEE